MSPESHIIQKLQNKGWVLADNKHPLGRLQGKSLDSFKLVILLGPKNRNGAHYFQLFFQNAAEELSLQPVIIGLHSQGKYPGYNWIEISQFSPKVSFQTGDGVLDINSLELTQKLFEGSLTSVLTSPMKVIK